MCLLGGGGGGGGGKYIVLKIVTLCKDFVQSNFYQFSFHSLFRSMLICQTSNGF